MTAPSPAPRRRFTLRTLAIWTLPGLLAGGQLIQFARPLEWWQCLLIGLRDWYIWMLFWPLLGWLVARFPLERNTWWRNFPAHVAGLVVTVSLYAVAHLGIGGLLRELMGVDIWPRWPPEGRVADLTALERVGLALRYRGSIYALVYAALVSVAFAMSYYQRYQERQRQAAELEAKLAEARLLALRMQLNPHFLFNALNAIASQVYDHPAAADEMIGSLSQLLRLSLDSSPEPLVPLRRELELLGLYLDLEKVRHGDRLTVVQHVAPETLDALVPSLILQPLVENAVKHGVERKPGPGRIELRAVREGDQLRLEVRDDGAGLPPPDQRREGVGLGNTHARLREMFGATHGLTLEPAPGGGVVASIRLPWSRQPVPASNPAPPPTTTA